MSQLLSSLVYHNIESKMIITFIVCFRNVERYFFTHFNLCLDHNFEGIRRQNCTNTCVVHLWIFDVTMLESCKQIYDITNWFKYISCLAFLTLVSCHICIYRYLFCVLWVKHFCKWPLKYSFYGSLYFVTYEIHNKHWSLVSRVLMTPELQFYN